MLYTERGIGHIKFLKMKNSCIYSIRALRKKNYNIFINKKLFDGVEII